MEASSMRNDHFRDGGVEKAEQIGARRQIGQRRRGDVAAERRSIARRRLRAGALGLRDDEGRGHREYAAPAGEIQSRDGRRSCVHRCD
ncbi:MAG: hypothetical protein DMF99_02415 [Acidobacteria bacterium]|nr:MAG: hypothetical protein DMF99_02415 [Acidobacteriota bacterium]